MYFYISKNITLSSVLLVFEIVERFQCILNSLLNWIRNVRSIEECIPLVFERVTLLKLTEVLKIAFLLQCHF